MDHNDNCNLVKAEKSDLTTLQQILSSCQLPTSDLTEHHLSHFYLLKRGTEAFGSVGLEIYRQHGLLRSLATKKQIRGKGFGQLLVKQIEKYAIEQDVANIYLLTTTAEAFFNKMGYSPIDRDDIPKEVKRSEEFSSICPRSATAMVKKL